MNVLNQLDFHLVRTFLFHQRPFGLEHLPKDLKQQMSIVSKDLIHQGSTPVCNDDILLMLNSEPHMMQLRGIANKRKLNLAPEKSFLMLLTVTNVGHAIDFFYS